MARTVCINDSNGKLTMLVDDEPVEGVLAVRVEHMGGEPVVQVTLQGVEEIAFRKPPEDEPYV